MEYLITHSGMGTVAAPQYVIVLTMRTDALLIKALEHALTTAEQIYGDQLVYHSGRGSQ